MAGKLDQSLEDILKTRKQVKGRAQGKRAGGRAVTNGDVKMTDAGSRVSKPSAKARPSRNAPRTVAPTTPLQKPTGESKIIVSGLPPDVGETQIQDYFSKTIGPVKRAFLTYGPNGQSKGIATITFKQANSGHEAASKLNGVRVDNRAMKIEVVLGANQAPIPAGLGDRIKSTSRPIPAKAQPKSAAATKTARGRAPVGAAKPKRGRNAGRPKAKTSEELDAEMTDYFVPKDSTNDANGVAGSAAPAGGDAAMDDQIL